MNPSDLADRIFGPSPLRVCVETVRDFVAATGDDPQRWRQSAPPGFISVALFAVASDLLRQLTDHSVIHGEQVFAWHRPFSTEADLMVNGTVSRVRERGGTSFVNFGVEVTDDLGPVADGSSLFLISGEFAPGASSVERSEPDPEYTGAPGPGQRSASRADLVRYAAATRDWNPIHWDHVSAVAAGLPGVVVHGLLQAAWALEASSRLRSGDVPLATARVRFRNPLLAAVPVSVELDETDGGVDVALVDSEVEYLSARIELTDR